MQFHQTGTDPTREARLVCRNARINLLILLALFWGFAGVIYYGGGHWVAYVWMVLCALLTPAIMASWRRRGSPENWVLAIYSDGIWLNLRDVAYHTAEAGNTIVSVPFSEILSVRKFIHRYSTPSSDGNTSHKDTYLEFLLNTDEAILVDVALKDDQKRKRGRAPIAVQGDNTLRIKFSTPNFGLRPNLHTTLSELGKYIRIEPESKEELPDLQKLSDAEFSKLVSELVAAGRRIDAVSLLRSRKQMTLTEAMDFVDELQKQINE